MNEPAGGGQTSGGPANNSAAGGPTNSGPTNNGPTNNGPTNNGPTNNGPTNDGHTRELPLPSDPWIGLAPAPAPAPFDQPAPHTHVVYVPEIVYVERRRRRKWPWLLALLALCLGCCGVCGSWAQPITAQWPAHVSIGAHAGGLRKDTSAATSLVAAGIAAQIRNNIAVEGSFAAKLDDPHDTSRWVLLGGATRLILDPAGEMDSAIKSSRKSMRLTGVTSYPPGPLGGELRCGKGRDDHDTPIAVCAWIDHGSEAVALCYGAWSVDAAAAEMRAIRSDVLTRH